VARYGVVERPSGSIQWALVSRGGDIPSRTLMRTPVVKRQTSPESGFFAFFPPCRSWCNHPLATCSDLVSLGWCGAHGLHHTLIEGLPPSPWRWPRAVGGSRRPRNISVPSYRPMQKRGSISLCASEVQGRVRGSTRQPSGPSTSWTGARGGVQANAQGQGKVPLCSWAFGDAMDAS
jgi:hypothetical protein